MLPTHREILKRVDRVEYELIEYDEKIVLIFEYLKQLEQEKQYNIEQQDRKKIGYKRHDN